MENQISKTAHFRAYVIDLFIMFNNSRENATFIYGLQAQKAVLHAHGSFLKATHLLIRVEIYEPSTDEIIFHQFN